MSAQHLDVRLTLPRAHFAVSVDLQLPANGITVLYGPSGSGKTSVLRAVAGLEPAQQARVVVGGEVWQDDAQGVNLPTHRRALGYVFQEASLFSHLDVQGNLRYGLSRVRSAQAEATLATAIELLGIGHLLARRVDGLSGGERQRVAIARALATSPRLLLLDEPLAALDQARREEVMPWLARLREQARLPMLYVTHSADEVARLADHLVVMDSGRVRAAGPVAEVLASMDPPVLAGDEVGVLLPGEVRSRDAAWHLIEVGFDGGRLWLRDDGARLGQSVRVRLLARDVSLSTEAPQHTSIQNHWAGVVDAIVDDAHPSQALVRVRCGGSAVLARVTRRALDRLGVRVGAPIWVQAKSAALLQ